MLRDCLILGMLVTAGCGTEAEDVLGLEGDPSAVDSGAADGDPEGDAGDPEPEPGGSDAPAASEEDAGTTPTETTGEDDAGSSDGSDAGADAGTPAQDAATPVDAGTVTDAGAGPTTGSFRLVSVSTDGDQGIGASGTSSSNEGPPAISSDGRFIAFQSEAANLVAGDTNDVGDIFVHDTSTGVTERVSVNSNGDQGMPDPANTFYDPGAYFADISRDGRFVLFTSTAINLVVGEPSGTGGLFLHDRNTGTTERVNLDSDENIVSSARATLSDDGRYIAFETTDAIDAGDTNGAFDIYVRDRTMGTTTRVSVADDGSQGGSPLRNPAISADGRYVAFSTNSRLEGEALNVSNVYVRDTVGGTTYKASVTTDGMGTTDQFGGSGSPAISADGRYVAFESGADDLTPDVVYTGSNIFVHDTQTGETTLVSPVLQGMSGDGQSISADISDDGRYVSFRSENSMLVENDTNGLWDAFRHDRTTGETVRITAIPGVAEADGATEFVALSGDGLHVVMTTEMGNLLAEDQNGRADIILWSQD